MKTAVSLPDDLFERAERLAARLGKSRSELYREALTEYLRQHDPREITESWNLVADEIETSLPPDIAAAGRRTLERTEW